MMKIQERCCQGLSASSASQRRTVEADTNVAMSRLLDIAAEMEKAGILPTFTRPPGY
ncbi:hypothetical protein [Streptomyces sp. NPDC002619]|uniref:hypothetical protein n=1 Tax=Streptomyces sp. NPDC002619 TaxID=3364655 RepID=UPI0036A4F045